MNPLTAPKWEIAVLLTRRPRVVRIQKDAEVFDFQGDHFEEVGLGFHNGFYDFLRSREGTIVGVRFFPTGEAETTVSHLTESDYVVRTRSRETSILLIFWRLDPSVDFASSDQYFGDNFIYRSTQSHELAIGFGIDILTEEEKTSLERISDPADNTQ